MCPALKPDSIHRSILCNEHVTNNIAVDNAFEYVATIDDYTITIEGA